MCSSSNFINQDNAKLIQQWKSGLKRTINWNKYQSKILTERHNQYLDFLIEQSFQRGHRPFALSFENVNDRTAHSRYLPKVEIKDCYFNIDGKNFFGQPRNNNIKAYENIWKIAAGQGDDYATDCLLDYP